MSNLYKWISYATEDNDYTIKWLLYNDTNKVIGAVRSEDFNNPESKWHVYLPIKKNNFSSDSEAMLFVENELNLHNHNIKINDES